MRVIKITTDNKISIIDIDLSNFREILSAIGGGCEIFESVSTHWLNYYFMQPVRMLVDDEGLMVNLDMNAVASWFYGYEEHGNPIVGNAVIVGISGPELVELEQVELYYVQLLSDFPALLEGGSDG